MLRHQCGEICEIYDFEVEINAVVTIGCWKQEQQQLSGFSLNMADPIDQILIVDCWFFLLRKKI